MDQYISLGGNVIAQEHLKHLWAIDLVRYVMSEIASFVKLI